MSHPCGWLFSYPQEGEVRFKVKQDASGLWAVIAPTGQVAGLCPTRWEADIAARGLTAFLAFSTRGGGGVKSFLYCQHCDREMQMRSAKVKIPGAIIAVSKTTCTGCHSRLHANIPLPGNDYDCSQCGAGVDTSYDGDGVKPSWGGWCQKCRRADGARRGHVKRRKREAEQKRQQARMDRAEHGYRLKREREMMERAERSDPALASYLARRRARLGAAA